MDRYEYLFVTLGDEVTADELCKYGADGWRVVPGSPIQKMRQTLGVVVGQLVFLMERQMSGGA